MKTYPKYFRIANQNILVVLVVIITLLGMSIKLRAQSPVLGNDGEKINATMKIQLKNYDFDVLVPKVDTNELMTYSDNNYNQLVYVTDEKPGFYMFFNNQWTKQTVGDVLTVIEMNLQMSPPIAESIIIQVGANGSKQLVDYNGHLSTLYNGFTFEKESGQLAIRL
ncbi:hypothetical protein JKA74_03920 [Marivirga sp. S37H4]|uniref:Uncharacterized protein n=1 Tax=Marivirga aurantiaca TaxID=2802615 RepID=A0A934WW60_9BACT|nr:hypothetical protein [Marivirga aurantiaca]MBK6264173.1 hypothetical protein [Marivirga aurantiaca]